MKVKTSKPFGMASSETFVGMGIVSDSGKEYLCFLDTAKAKDAMDTHKKHTTLSIASECCYVEEIHYAGRNKTLETASLHQVAVLPFRKLNTKQAVVCLAVTVRAK